MKRASPRHSVLYPLAVTLLLLAGLSVPMRAPAAGEVVACFAQGKLGLCSQRVLEHVGFKSVVLQFVDPQNTGLGEGLARLLWREILESISDLSGAGVILAYDREGAIREALGGRDYEAFLAKEYHAAAEQIARQLGVQMSIWGVVLEDGQDLYVQNFLTLYADDKLAWTTLSVGQPSGPSLAAAIGQQRLNFAPHRASREALFARSWTTRCALSAGCPGGVELRAGPSNDSPVVAKVPEGSALKGHEMVRQWLKVERPDGGEAYINLYYVEMFPDRVTFVNRRAVVLRAAAGTGARSLAKVDLDGDYVVLGAARAEHSEPWYRIAVDGREGWVAGRLVERRSYLFPVVHLIAGLFRYARGDFDRAVSELEAFLADAEDEDNVTRAAARQFLAASRLAGREGRGRGIEAALGDLDRAVDLTPFDPGAYSLRAVVRLGSGRSLDASLADLKQALSLDRNDAGSQGLLGEMLSRLHRWGLQPLAPGQDVRPAEELLQDLGASYAQ
jgi:tetratricopeptide (TPR) repeat protein